MRIVHLGLGAFHRAHQAWYTARASDAADWGIAAFTGRSPAMAERLGPQDGLYTLIERGAQQDRFEIVDSIVEVADGADVPRLVELIGSPEVVIVTMTITEAGYRLAPDLGLDLGDAEIAADIRILVGLSDGRASVEQPSTPLGRLCAGLLARMQREAGPISVVPCDNLPDNGALTGRAVRLLAAQVSSKFARWVDRSVDFVSTSVDRITPRTTDRESEIVLEQTGRIDAAPVVTEPFTDWVLRGHFRQGRPKWEEAGARFVSDIEPWEQRKLWMLNGAHTLLAELGMLRGHRTVAEAIADPLCREAVELLWDDDERNLPDFAVDSYREALLERFGNARIEHQLTQIRAGDVAKLQLRIVPVALREIGVGRAARGCAGAIAAWILAETAERAEPQTATDRAMVAERVGALSPALGAHDAFVATVHGLLDRFAAVARPPLDAVIVMGVSGSGKSTIGALVASRLGATFIDADDLHPAANIAKMASGVPLDDDDRRPWLRAVAAAGAAVIASGGTTVIACSALKREYREILRSGISGRVAFVHLDAATDVLERRQGARPDHFMPPALFRSQVEILEPLRDEAGFRVDVTASPETIADLIARQSAQRGRPPSQG